MQHDKNGWLAIETAPKDGTHVLVYVPPLRQAGTAKYLRAFNTTGVQWWSVGSGACLPSHWMPLPPPPQD